MSFKSDVNQRKFFVKDLNTHLVCSLCDGYFREAHTVPDCLHTFCKCCLFKEFAKKALKDAKSCPTCKFNLGLRPYDKVVYDRNLQALVDKVFPHFAEQDKILEEQFYATCEQEEAANNSNLVVRSRLLPQSAPVKRQLPVQDNGKHNPNKKPNNSESSSSSKGAPVSAGSAPAQDVQGLTLRVIPFEDSSSTIPPADALPSLTKPLLRVTARSVTVDKIQRFIHKRMGVPSTFCPADIELLRDGIVLDQTSTITELPIPPPTDDGTGAIAVATQVAKAESVIILAYRKKS